MTEITQSPETFEMAVERYEGLWVVSPLVVG